MLVLVQDWRYYYTFALVRGLKDGLKLSSAIRSMRRNTLVVKLQ